MVETIAKIAWKNNRRGYAHFLTLNNKVFNCSIERLNNWNNYYDGQWVVIDHQPMSSSSNSEIPIEAHHIHELKMEKREDFLIACFTDGTDRTLAIEALRFVTPQKVLEKLREDYQINNNVSQKETPRITHQADINSNKIEKYELFKTYVEECFKPLEFKTGWETTFIPSLVTQKDIDLADKWMPPNSKNVDADLAKMLSARIAEKIAQKFYEQFHFGNIDDISSSQLIKGSDEWRKYDIKLSDRICIDVKNARNPINNKIRYVDYCVPEFKKSREGKEVIIAGVLSPYLRLAQLRGEEPIDTEINDIIFLGETRETDIRLLEEQFDSEHLQIDICSHHIEKGKHILPPWVFNYPKQCYQDQNDARENLRRFRPQDFPPEQIWDPKYNPVPAIVASGIPIPQKWKSIDTYQRDLVNRLNRHGENCFSLPLLYLSILEEFLEKIKAENELINYDPTKYRNVVFPLGYHPTMPIGLFDPLSTVDDLIYCLALLWKNRAKINFGQIKRYKFRGMGILTAEFLDGEVKTLLAYCGGKVHGVTCGYRPLVYGENKTCDTCHRLICDKCKCCTENCKDYLNRKRNFGLY